MKKDKRGGARGGARKGAGRKSMKDKKVSVPIWMRPSEIKKNGGIKKVKLLMYDAVGCSPNFRM